MAIETIITRPSCQKILRSRADNTKQIAKTAGIAIRTKRTIDAEKIMVAMEIRAVVSSPFREDKTGSDVTNASTSNPRDIENDVAALSNPNTSGLRAETTLTPGPARSRQCRPQRG